MTLQKLYACVEFCTPVLVLYEMQAENKAGLTRHQMLTQLILFYDTMMKILQHEEARPCLGNFKLLIYDG